MITVLNGHPEAMQGYICGVTLRIGQWATVSGFDTDADTPKIQVPATGLAPDRVFPVLRYPKDSEEMETIHDGTYTAVSGTRVIGVRGEDILIEDDYTMVNIGIADAAWDTLTIGSGLALNATGYLDPRLAEATHPVVARVEKIDLTNNVLIYRTAKS